MSSPPSPDVWCPVRTRALRFVFLLSFIAGAAAAKSSRVALVRPAASDALLAEATTRLSAELTAAGFEVTLLDAEPGTDPRALVESANLDPPPVATLTIQHVGEAAAADVWVADRLTGKTSVRHVDVGTATRERAPSVLAVRAVELLRASLLEATTPAAEAPDSAARPAVPEDVARWMAPQKAAPKNATGESPNFEGSLAEPGGESRALGGRRGSQVRLFAQLGAGAVFGLRGVSAAFSPLVRVGVGNNSFAGRLSVIAPALGADVAGPGGSASIQQELAVIEGVASFPSRGTWALLGSLGAGAYHWHVAGAAEAPYVAHTGEIWGAAFDAGLGAVARIGDSSGFLLDAHALAFAPRPAVQITGQSAGGASGLVALATVGFWEAF